MGAWQLNFVKAILNMNILLNEQVWKCIGNNINLSETKKYEEEISLFKNFRQPVS